MKLGLIRYITLVFLLALAAPAQNTTVSATGAAPASPLPPLPDNVVLAFKGTFEADTPVDFTWTGAGPQMSKTTEVLLTSATEAILQFKGTIRETKDGCWLEFSLSLQLPVVSSGAVTYRNLPFQAAVNLKPGQPVVVLDHNGKTITVTLTREAGR